MTSFGEFERLARAAQEEPPPQVDVVERVLERIRGTAPREPGSRAWLFAVGVSATAAASVYLALHSLMGLQEPFVELLNTARGAFI